MARFEIARSADIAAPRERVHALIDDFHAWTKWSPWEDVDPALRRTYAGAERGVGARYGWSGNRRAGAGSMAIAASSPEQVLVDLSFTKPVKARNDLAFDLAESDRGTRVTWTMRGENRGVAAIFWRIFPMERELGKQFEQGLAQLKAAAETP
ncbi:SRPBCC family protein [Agrococcus sp. SL85]|uniref:SRPBCC family protein n=1 Tax=Agrococcus sp. SL85 TaxID=2995141 RepID=UPI00226C6978|nr:SRPBCC family protein [Agrococcus sp. SL85]WAC65518.1 SRPBCC family protein [Agrococcus sp. SL85]